MKKLIILTIGVFMSSGIFAQNPCDARLFDKLSNNKNYGIFLKVFTIDSETQKNDTMSMVLRNNTYYRFVFANSEKSENPVEINYFMSKKNYTEKQLDNQDLSALSNAVLYELEKTENGILMIHEIIQPGEVREIDYLPPKTEVHNLFINFKGRGRGCMQAGLYFVKKISTF
jgi:hypothetical protein